ncbi:PilO family type IV pilus biogenesis protein TapO [Aeromonas enteropelogenes]|uniref:PilO family type IV pilus biogenesis protein TapO n=2 Tax=Aeromonas TaxID=642 RepID=A0A175VMX4_AEREN|nr:MULTISPECIES: PilO family type IV pilus biogenesis protein TapO [Aeromonas]KXU81807.1 pilus assembly protein PilP [Aeromonas enteropelogenes]MBL0455728.1 PilO family type IV pilus biogenesis protein TapO [Aeromonas enteropelogenes]MBL0520384.1 PilO family type IV pilus biogenesis protein TapO [Aeromonas enteropelogenes]MCZ0751244.1 PilO family type IV pilus biogenesis protein TapO [Aeromonas enteropelogenes]QXC33978.1 PilO family type IV pilus biogenesis protein TapO [Aeromonas sp. FDAARGOS
MNLQQLNELDINDIASWPKWAKGIFIFFCCALTGGALYYYVIANSLTLLTQETDKETELKAQFESKAMLAANLGAYKEQMVTLEQMVDTQLKQLPNTHEVAGLLDDISFIATDNGLKLNRINWEPEVKHEFSTELPMRIEVVGSYHEIGKFTADMAALPRIVILDSFTLGQNKDAGDLISMSMLAKTYKYNGKTGEAK